MRTGDVYLPGNGLDEPSDQLARIAAVGYQDQFDQVPVQPGAKVAHQPGFDPGEPAIETTLGGKFGHVEFVAGERVHVHPMPPGELDHRGGVPLTQ